MAERSPKGTPKPGPAVRQERVSTSDPSSLGADEEKVVRMARGAAVDDEAPLVWDGAGRPEVAEELRALELRALEKSGRLAELQAAAGLRPEDAERRRKIVQGLKAKKA